MKMEAKPGIPAGSRAGNARRTSEKWAAAWVEKFKVCRQRRFGPAAVVNPEPVADFQRFIAVRWGAPE